MRALCRALCFMSIAIYAGSFDIATFPFQIALLFVISITAQCGWKD